MIAADKPTKTQTANVLAERFSQPLLRALAERPRYRWEVWLAFAGDGLSAPQAVVLIERVKKAGWVFEHNGLLFSCSSRKDFQ